MNDLISVIMPAFGVEGHAKLFEKCISGLKNQTYGNFETLIGIDGGSEITINYVKSIINKYDFKNVRLFKSNDHIGPDILRNILFNYSSGNFLTFHDSDDYSYPERFKKLLESIDEDGIIASYIYLNYINEPQKSRKRMYFEESKLPLLLKDKKVRVQFHFPCAMMTKNLFIDMGGFEKYKYSLGATLAIKLCYYREMIGIKPVPIIKEILFDWNRRESSITTSIGKIKEDVDKSEKEMRDPLINRFREMVLSNKISVGDSKDKIKKYLGLSNNLNPSDVLIEVKIGS